MADRICACINCAFNRGLEAAAQQCELDVDWAEFAGQKDIDWKGFDRNELWSQISQPCSIDDRSVYGSMHIERHCADGGLKRYLTGIITARVIAANIRRLKRPCALWVPVEARHA